MNDPTARSFPTAEVERRLRVVLDRLSGAASVLRPSWEPLLDSLVVVGTVVVLEDLFPGCRLPPDKVVKKGGYFSVDEAIGDMVPRIRDVVNKSKEGNANEQGPLQGSRTGR